jgi:hypothetical protein
MVCPTIVYFKSIVRLCFIFVEKIFSSSTTTKLRTQGIYLIESSNSFDKNDCDALTLNCHTKNRNNKHAQNNAVLFEWMHIISNTISKWVILFISACYFFLLRGIPNVEMWKSFAASSTHFTNFGWPFYICF